MRTSTKDTAACKRLLDGGKRMDLSAVLKMGVSELDTKPREQIEYIDIDLIESDPNNFYSLEGIDELAENIELCGLQQPIRVRPSAEEAGKVVIVSGHRRCAALRKLAEDGRPREVPCIRETDECSPALRELRLIYANADTRRLSAAEISQQAERVEALLYQLKEEGYEFPGRMRDHVAEACRVSASKLARLKVIREKLVLTYLPHFRSGELSEAAAYALAKQPTDVQTRLMDYILRRISRHETISEMAIYGVVNLRENLDGRTCPMSKSASCEHIDRIWKKVCRDGMYRSCANSGGCCYGCCLRWSCPDICPSYKAKLAAKAAPPSPNVSPSAEEEPEPSRPLAAPPESEPEKASPAPEQAAVMLWIPGSITPRDACECVASFDIGGGRRFKTICWWDGTRFLFKRNGESVEMTPARWIALPEDGEETEDE